ncbi:MAG: DEAD/DEAH box helicase family protein [Patescibacteria group bacterium]|nr:DEAD/DEAH box helicase family protein [Patescibacteria group bacterium]
MQLKRYQQETLDKLSEYLAELQNYPREKAASVAFVSLTDKAYNRIPELGSSPFVCVKAPTGGGKTLIAANAVGVVFEHYLDQREDRGLVMWLVPSDTIKTQTLGKFRDRNDAIRQSLDARFGGRVRILDLTEAKQIKKEDLADNLCIVVSTFAAFRREDKEGLKVYQDNGALMGHFEDVDLSRLNFLDKDKNGNPVYSLANVVKMHNPLVVVDEGHNIQTELSLDMLKAINPSFVLEFTATPKGKSNVLVGVAAQELKDEMMIKMPIYLANVARWQDTIFDGIGELNKLRKLANKNKQDYIRPIMLIQAEQEKESPKKVHVAQVRDFLIREAKISEEEIAIQTGKQKELPAAGVLMGRSCKIRFVITVNALREGWDCPFAYVLVSVSNLGARISVEQTIGRIMRLPYVKEHKYKELNQAYIFATTNNFTVASRAVIEGLKENGYEGIVADNKTLKIENKFFGRHVKDANISVPFLNVKDGSSARRLEYVYDLIGGDNILKGKESAAVFNFVDESHVEKIDIGSGGALVRDRAGKLDLAYHYEGATRDNILTWLVARVQRSFIGIDEMKVFLESALGKLVKKSALNRLSAGRYRLKEILDGEVDALVNSATKTRFDKLLKSKKLIAKGECFKFPEKIELSAVSGEPFSKHLYEKAGGLNGEELDFARKVDDLKNVSWWFRNPESGGFYIQGWLKDRFYPDFVVKTKKGNYFIVEYKGEHLSTGEDSDYKKKIGKWWGELCSGRYRFEWAEKDNIGEIVNKISLS